MPNRDAAIAALSKKLPSSEVMMRLQALYREIASPNGCDLAVLERIGLRDEQINRIHQEVADLLLSPLGVDLMIELLPPLIAISTRGAKLNRTADI